MNKRITIAGVPFDAVTYDDVLAQVREFVSRKERVYFTTPNPEMVLEASRNKDFLKILQGSSLNMADGTGILWASTYLEIPGRSTRPGRWLRLYSSLISIMLWPRLLKHVLPARVTGADLLDRVASASGKEGWKIFLLGAGPGVAEKATAALKVKYPAAEFVGAYEGSPREADDADLRARVNAAAPDILFVAYGSPVQELWIARNLPHLHSVKVAVGVGGAFDFAAGAVRRAPRFMQALGIEWLWRLLRQPGRIGRILNATFRFVRYIHGVKYR